MFCCTRTQGYRLFGVFLCCITVLRDDRWGREWEISGITVKTSDISRGPL